MIEEKQITSDEKKQITSDEKLKLRTKPVKKKITRLAPKKKRIPMRKQKRIGMKKIPGYHVHVFNDIGDRIRRAQEAGYELIEREKVQHGEKDAADASPLSKKFACQHVGNGVMGYYMKIPIEYYEESQEELKQERKTRQKMIGHDKIPENVRRTQTNINFGPLQQKEK